MAKKSKYCQEYEDFIVEHYGLGFGLTRISKALGIPEQTVIYWKNKKPGLHSRMVAARMAEATRRLKGTGNEWWLERKVEEFRKPREEIDVSGELTINSLLEIRKRINESIGFDDDQSD